MFLDVFRAFLTTVTKIFEFSVKVLDLIQCWPDRWLLESCQVEVYQSLGYYCCLVEQCGVVDPNPGSRKAKQPPQRRKKLSNCMFLRVGFSRWRVGDVSWSLDVFHVGLRSKK
jgi:hypothetical protein